MNLYRQTMQPDGNMQETEICRCPDSLISSRSGLINFFKLYAGREFGGREGRDWRIMSDPRCLVPVYVNQLVPCKAGAGAMAGAMEYGESLIVK